MNLKNPDIGQNTPLFPEDQKMLLVDMGTENSNTFGGQAGNLCMGSSEWNTTWAIESESSGKFRPQQKTCNLKNEKPGSGPSKIPR